MSGIPMRRQRGDTAGDGARELRAFRAPLAIRRRAEGDPEPSGPGTLEGVAAVYDQEIDLYWYRESIAPGAFSDSLEADDQRALVNHDTSLVIGRTSSGTLRCEDADDGLRVEIDLPDTSYGRDIYESVSRGDIDGMSIGFRVQTEEHILPEEGSEERVSLWRVTRAELLEVSPVAFPAYEGTSVSARSMDRREAARNEREEAARQRAADAAEKAEKAEREAAAARENAGTLARARDAARRRKLRLMSLAHSHAAAELTAADPTSGGGNAAANRPN